MQKCAVLCFVVIIYVVVLKALICNSECIKFHTFKLVENDLPSEIYSAKSSYKTGWVVGFIGCWICWILCSRALSKTSSPLLLTENE